MLQYNQPHYVGALVLLPDLCLHQWLNTIHFSLRLGDIGEVGKAGSLHEYLTILHDEGRCPVTSFWFGKEHVVSICSPQAFKDTVKLTDRAGEQRREKFFQRAPIYCRVVVEVVMWVEFGTLHNLFSSLAVQLQIAFAPLIGRNSIQYSAGSDWEDRRRCLYPVFKGEALESYYPHFVHIAQVRLAAMWYIPWAEDWLRYCRDQNSLNLGHLVSNVTSFAISRICFLIKWVSLCNSVNLNRSG